MEIETRIKAKLLAEFAPSHLAVHNESPKHNVPVGSESHFQVVLVSNQFDGQRLLQRHRAVNQLLAEELAGPVHALALHTYTETEWSDRQQAPQSPDCLGGEGKSGF